MGFVGPIVVASPSPTDPVNQYALLSILAALFTGSVTVILKRLSAFDPSRTIMVWHSVILLAVLALPAWADWRWPTLHQWELAGVMGLLMVGTQWTSIQALRLSDASAMAPIEYTRLIQAAVLGFAVFGHVPDAATMLVPPSSRPGLEKELLFSAPASGRSSHSADLRWDAVHASSLKKSSSSRLKWTTRLTRTPTSWPISRAPSRFRR